MRGWLQVQRRVLTVELVVVGIMVSVLGIVIVLTPLPPWVPATVLWVATLGFVAYRIVYHLVQNDEDGRMSSSRRDRSISVDEIGVLTVSKRSASDLMTPQVDLRATLLDVPSVADTNALLKKVRVLSDDDIAAAQSDTLMLDSPVGRGDTSTALAETMELDAIDDRASTLDEATWQRLQDEDVGTDERSRHD